MLERFWYAAALALAGETPTHEFVAQAARQQHTQIMASLNGEAH
jgi:hypothetical protein